MPKKTETANKVPRFTIEVPKVSGVVAKLAVPRCGVNDLGDTIAKLIEQASESGVEIKVVKGTLTCY